LVDNPFEGAAVAEFVFVDFGRDAAQRQEAVISELGFVSSERHSLYAPVKFAGFSALERVFGLLFVIDVELHEGCADFCVFLEG